MSKVASNPLRTIGTIAPSSRFLANAMVGEVIDGRKNILEIGAGTGAITDQIIKHKLPEQRLDIVEIMPWLAKIVSQKFANYPNVKIYNQDIRNFCPDIKYDLIISSLPFNAFKPSMTTEIFNKILEISTDKAHMTFFEYGLTKSLGPLVLNKEEKKEFYANRKIIEDFISKYSYQKKRVNFNFPPALVYYLLLTH